ncbi:hypothetical protein [Streptomyces meridianus]|uniref:Uncharacterized protein n=1 Tax=Streptomyces meridianus TaxID=2938945 RepID=A0ABT0X0C3_9ACTN|nr:hypothetical protein [Streptomyces meridianus]MCM2576013.1 hypothetical protein [Streptomyces meridianus]
MSHNQPPPPPGGGQGPYAAAGGPGFGPPHHPAGGAAGPPRPGDGLPQPNPYASPGAYAPHGPYPPQGQPAGPPYGMPRAPQGGGGKGRTIGLAVGAAVLVASVVGGVVLFGGAGDERYELTTPARVAAVFDREGPGESGPELNAADRKALEQLPGVADPRPVAAQYRAPGERKLMLTGVSGRVGKPEQVVDATFLVLAESLAGQDTTPVGSPETLTPEGLDDDAVMKCQKFRVRAPAGSGGPSTVDMPVCVWGDASTVGAVLVVDPLAAVTGNVKLSDTAGTAAKVRTDARVEIEQ